MPKIMMKMFVGNVCLKCLPKIPRSISITFPEKFPYKGPPIIISERFVNIFPEKTSKFFPIVIFQRIFKYVSEKICQGSFWKLCRKCTLEIFDSNFPKICQGSRRGNWRNFSRVISKKLLLKIVLKGPLCSLPIS